MVRAVLLLGAAEIERSLTPEAKFEAAIDIDQDKTPWAPS